MTSFPEDEASWRGEDSSDDDSSPFLTLFFEYEIAMFFLVAIQHYERVRIAREERSNFLTLEQHHLGGGFEREKRGVRVTT